MNPFAWFRHDRRRDELSEEIQSHIEEKTDELVARGLSRADAEREARRAFGNITSIKEVAGDVWRFETHIENVASDVRHALRGLIQKPSFTLAVILTLALGIGANAVVFALVNALVLRPLPYPEADRLVSVTERNDEGRDSRALTDLVYVDWLGSTQSLVSSAAYEETQAVLRTSEGTRRITGLRATPSYFGILGVRPMLGRTFDESEALPGGRRVVVLSEPFWRERFAATLRCSAERWSSTTSRGSSSASCRDGSRPAGSSDSGFRCEWRRPCDSRMPKAVKSSRFQWWHDYARRRRSRA